EELPKPCVKGISLLISTLNGGIVCLNFEATLFATLATKFCSLFGKTFKKTSLKLNCQLSAGDALTVRNLLRANPIESNPTPKFAVVAGTFISNCDIYSPSI